MANLFPGLCEEMPSKGSMYAESIGWPGENMRSGTDEDSKSMLLARDSSFSPETLAFAEFEAAGNMVKLKSEVLF